MRTGNRLKTRAALIAAGVALVLSASKLQAACKVLAPGTAWSGGNGAAAPSPLVSQAPNLAENDLAQRNEDFKGANRIVGMWLTDFILEGTTTPADHVIEQFSSDGNELINSSAFPPASENKCYGIWRASRTGEITLTHIGFDYSVDTGAFKGTVRTLVRFSRTGAARRSRELSSRMK
ncbi:MAG: hypothetical protein ACJ746_12330 [Bryobacteraceae bacterium]